MSPKLDGSSANRTSSYSSHRKISESAASEDVTSSSPKTPTTATPGRTRRHPHPRQEAGDNTASMHFHHAAGLSRTHHNHHHYSLATSSSELYLNDKSMYKKDAGSVCEFLSNRLQRNSPPSSKIRQEDANERVVEAEPDRATTTTMMSNEDESKRSTYDLLDPVNDMDCQQTNTNNNNNVMMMMMVSSSSSATSSSAGGTGSGSTNANPTNSLDPSDDTRSSSSSSSSTTTTTTLDNQAIINASQQQQQQNMDKSSSSLMFKNVKIIHNQFKGSPAPPSPSLHSDITMRDTISLKVT